MVELQQSLFDQGRSSVTGPLTGHVERLVLAEGAWVDVCRQWVCGSDTLLARLVERVDWRAEQRWMYDHRVSVPRLVRFYSEGDPLPDPALDDVKGHLDRHYAADLGEPFATAGLALYRDGRDSVAWHGDTIGRGALSDTVVAIVSLGATRRFLLRRRGGGPSLRFELGSGDLLVMGGSCQRTWEHAIPKTMRPLGGRMSVQFRPQGVR